MMEYLAVTTSGSIFLFDPGHMNLGFTHLTLMVDLGPELRNFLTSEIDVLGMLVYLCLIAAAIPALMFAVNVWFFRRPGTEWNRRLLPPVSILIPARNEEHSIGAAVASVLASRGINFELIVLDDGSTDRTADLVRAAGKLDDRVRLETCPPLPPGWNGKQHACWVLASLAAYDALCFLDADVRVGRQAIFRLVSEMNEKSEKKAEMALVSGFPRQQTETFLEKLLLPLIHFVLLGFLPMPGERWSGKSGFAAGCGQVMLVGREAYFASGGHSSIRTTMHDGLLLPQLFRNHGFKTAVFDLSHDAVCRMYRNASEVWEGLSKNATEGMASKRRIWIFTGLLLFGQVLPLIGMVAARIANDHKAFRHAILAFVLGYAIRVVSAWRYKESWLGAALHPIGVLVLLVLQWRALVDKVNGRTSTWKQRAYSSK